MSSFPIQPVRRVSNVVPADSAASSPSRRPVRFLMAALLVLALLAPGMAFARGGGLFWGYNNNAAGNPFINLWLMTNPWAQMSGWAIPHHNLGPNGLPPQDDYGNPVQRSPYNNTWRSQPFDRSVAFTGSASQPSSYVPPTRPMFGNGSTPVPTGPYRVDRTLYPPYHNNYNSYWRNGYWGGGLRGWAQWGRSLAERAFPRWSVGPLYYLSGYGVYRNPFISLGAAPAAPYLDYRQPLIDVEAHAPTPRQKPKEDENADDLAAAAADDALRYQEAREFLVRTPQMSAGLKALDSAREAFRRKDYDAALKLTDDGLQHLPQDPAFHEFRALVLFARGEYHEAATAIYAVLAVSPGWDWATFSSMYTDQEELTGQLRRLENYRKAHPDEPDIAFLLAYHYTTCRHNASAVRLLRNVAKQLPEDNLTPPLISLLAGADDKAAAAAGDSAATPAVDPGKPAPASTELDLSKVVGEWKAIRSGGATIELKLTEDGAFTWLANGRRLEGVYATSGSRIILISSRGQLPGKVTPRDGGGFHFSMSENDPTDPGLEFVKK